MSKDKDSFFRIKAPEPMAQNVEFSVGGVPVAFPVAAVHIELEAGEPIGATLQLDFVPFEVAVADVDVDLARPAKFLRELARQVEVLVPDRARRLRLAANALDQ